jgi:hypothetical protein
MSGVGVVASLVSACCWMGLGLRVKDGGGVGGSKFMCPTDWIRRWSSMRRMHTHLTLNVLELWLNLVGEGSSREGLAFEPVEMDTKLLTWGESRAGDVRSSICCISKSAANMSTLCPGRI